jgi:hypothetical protein
VKLLERMMDAIPGLRRVRVEQARRDQRAQAQEHRATALSKRVDDAAQANQDRADRIAQEMRALGQAFRR